MLEGLDEVIKWLELDVVAFTAFGALTELDLGGSEDNVSLRELDEDLLFAVSFSIEVAFPAVDLNDALLIKVDGTRFFVVVDELRDSDRLDELIELT